MISLHAHQVPHVAKLVKIIRDRNAAHDGSDAGTGKTICAAMIAKELGAEVLVICPKSVAPFWDKILAEVGVTGTAINYEMAWRKMGKVTPWGKGSFFKFDRVWPLVIFDESHRTAGETTLNSKLLIAAKRQGSRILSLSATAADSVMKFRSLGFILGLHSLTNYRDWLASYGVVAIEFELRDGRKVKKLVISKGNNANAMKRLHDQIYGERGSRMRIADIPNFPKTQIEVRTISDAPKEVLRLDEEMRKFHTNRQALGAISSEEQGKLVYMRQAFETAKVPLLLDMTEDALETSRVAIFVNFTVTLEQLIAQAKKLKWTVGWIRGDQDPAERQKFIDDFQANKLDVIVCNIQAGGVGVSLHDPVTQVPRTAILCPTWSATDLKQALGRVHRDGGGTSRQFIVFFENCVEERVAKSVEKKLNNLSLLNDQELAGELADEPQAALPL